MSESENTPTRDADHWAKPVSALHVADARAGGLNVEGRRVVGPIQGFGQLWQKTFRARLEGVTVAPAEVIRAWKDEFPRFWGGTGAMTFYAPAAGMAPGEVGVIKSASIASPPMSTGVLVLYADDESFTLMTPQGHPYAGWVTFSASTEDGTTVIQAQEIFRADDPLYELLMPILLHRQQNAIWQKTLKAVAANFGAAADVSLEVVCVDSRRQWSNAKNIWQNAGIRSGLHLALAPFRWLAKPFRGR